MAKDFEDYAEEWAKEEEAQRYREADPNSFYNINRRHNEARQKIARDVGYPNCGCPVDK